MKRKNSEQALNLLKEYLNKKWYQGSRDAGWYDLHKQNIKIMWDTGPFGSGAICKIKGLDYKQLEGVPYFPYDLVAEGSKV